MGFDIEIYPLKRLYYNLNNERRKACAIIATSYEVRKDKISALESALILSFADITDSSNSDSFNKNLANKIHLYINNLPPDIEVLFICCDSGESRSSAIASSLMRYYGKDDEAIWSDPHYHPNPLVYKLLCEELSIVLSEGEVEEKVSQNNEALKKAISRARNN